MFNSDATILCDGCKNSSIHTKIVVTMLHSTSDALDLTTESKTAEKIT